VRYFVLHLLQQSFNISEIWGFHGGEDDDAAVLGCDTLKMETVCLSETLTPACGSTRRHNPEQHRFNIRFNFCCCDSRASLQVFISKTRPNFELTLFMKLDKVAHSDSYCQIPTTVTGRVL
jgi:hypothetical protein